MKTFNVTDFLNKESQKNYYCQTNVEDDIVEYFKEIPVEWHRPAKDFFIHLCLRHIDKKAWFVDLCQLSEYLEQELERIVKDRGIDIKNSPTFKLVKELIEDEDI